MVEKQLSLPVMILHTDYRGKFTSQEFEFCYNVAGILHQLLAPQTPQQNSVAEHKNRTVIEMAYTLLKQMNVPPEYWAEAVATVVYILNRSPTSALRLQTPLESLIGMRPSM